MIHSDRFLISQRPYAVRRDSLQVETSHLDHGTYHRGELDAVWFRRRSGVTVACIGSLRGMSRDTAPTDVEDFLRGETDGRYGGLCEGRWNGSGYWGAEDPDVAAAHLEILRPMLAAYPEVPPGYHGWWRYPTTAELKTARLLALVEES